MNVKRIKKLINSFNFKKRNGLVPTEELLAIVKEYASPYMTPEEIEQLILNGYRKLYKALPDVDDVTNIKNMLGFLKNLIKEFEGIVQLDDIINNKVSDLWKQEKLSVAEEKFSILLGNLSDVILDYVKGPIGEDDEENSYIWKENEKLDNEIAVYMQSSVNNSGIDRFYYHCIIPYFRNLYETAKEAVNQNNVILLWQVAEVSKCRVILRSKIMANILS